MTIQEEYLNRRFVIIDSTELDMVDFDQVLETSIDTARRSVDGFKAVIKYDMPQPSSVAKLNTKSQEYTYDEILDIMLTPEWELRDPF